jgi:hypothetical protein
MKTNNFFKKLEKKMVAKRMTLHFSFTSSGPHLEGRRVQPPLKEVLGVAKPPHNLGGSGTTIPLKSFRKWHEWFSYSLQGCWQLASPQKLFKMVVQPCSKMHLEVVRPSHLRVKGGKEKGIPFTTLFFYFFYVKYFLVLFFIITFSLF